LFDSLSFTRFIHSSIKADPVDMMLCGDSAIIYIPERVRSVTCVPDFGSTVSFRGIARELSGIVEAIRRSHSNFIEASIAPGGAVTARLAILF
jgi:hypothetical protein